MKILMLTPYLPYPPASGGQIRTFYLLKYLSQWHDITLISLYKNDAEKAYVDPLYAFCKKIYLCRRAPHAWQTSTILKTIFSTLPLLIVRNYSREASETLADLLKKETFDVIHAETFYIMPHIPPTSIPVLLVEQTIEYKVYQHYISQMFWPVKKLLSIDIKKLKYWETHYWKKAQQVAAVSEADNREIERLTPHLNPIVVPNGAGDEMFVDHLEIPDMHKPELLFVGNFYWLQNVEAAEYLISSILPKLKEVLPEAVLTIAGQNSVKLKHLTGSGVNIIDLPSGDTEKVKNLYHRATLFVAPIFGPGGTRLKILASMASGLPVISTQTGIDGLHVKPGTHALIAETAGDFVKQIATILHDTSLYKKIQVQAFEHVNKYFSWKSIASDLDAVYQRMHTQS